jgi:hypothetical protein
MFALREFSYRWISEHKVHKEAPGPETTGRHMLFLVLEAVETFTVQECGLWFRLVVAIGYMLGCFAFCSHVMMTVGFGLSDAFSLFLYEE